MAGFELKDIAIEDIEDVLIKVEDSFNFRFVDDELLYIKTFGQLCIHIQNKLQLADTGGCTTQQAFYKLRSALGSNVTPSMLLKDVLPRPGRVSAVRVIEKQLGFKLHLLKPPQYVASGLVIGIMASAVLLLYDWKTGLAGMVYFSFALIIAHKTTKNLTVKTVGQLAQKIARESYTQARRNPFTYNANEVEKVLVDLFSTGLTIHPSKLIPTAAFR